MNWSNHRIMVRCDEGENARNLRAGFFFVIIIAVGKQIGTSIGGRRWHSNNSHRLLALNRRDMRIYGGAFHSIFVFSAISVCLHMNLL